MFLGQYLVHTGLEARRVRARVSWCVFLGQYLVHTKEKVLIRTVDASKYLGIRK